MQFKSFEPGIEVMGLGLQWVVAGFRILPETGLRYLSKYGLTTPGQDGKPTLDIHGWYPQDAWLACFEAINREVGPSVMQEIGRHLGQNGPMPPNVKDIDAALRSVDVTYHMFHRKRGKLMFDPATGQMIEGIGHYLYERKPGESRITSVCENPYPCDFDLGFQSAFAARFQPRAGVTHVANAPCRKNGAESCTYAVTW